VRRTPGLAVPLPIVVLVGTPTRGFRVSAGAGVGTGVGALACLAAAAFGRSAPGRRRTAAREWARYPGPRVVTLGGSRRRPPRDPRVVGRRDSHRAAARLSTRRRRRREVPRGPPLHDDLDSRRFAQGRSTRLVEAPVVPGRQALDARRSRQGCGSDGRGAAVRRGTPRRPDPLRATAVPAPRRALRRPSLASAWPGGLQPRRAVSDPGGASVKGRDGSPLAPPKAGKRRSAPGRDRARAPPPSPRPSGSPVGERASSRRPRRVIRRR